MDEIAPLLKTNYLSIWNDEIKTKYGTIFWGRHGQLLTAMPVRLSNKRCPTRISVIFKIDTGSPITTITREVLQKLFNTCTNV
jgi:hypothetical protein